MADRRLAFAEELQREPEPTPLNRVTDRFRQLGVAFAVLVVVAMTACNLLCWGGF